MKVLLVLLLLIPIVVNAQITETFESFDGPGEWTSPGGNTGSHDGELCYNLVGAYDKNTWYIFESPVYDFSGYSAVELFWYQESDIRSGDSFRLYYFDGSWSWVDISNLNGFYGVTLSNTTTRISFDLLTYGNGNVNGRYSHVGFLEIYDPSPLPIELKSFDAQLQDEGVLLEWVTSSEYASDIYSLYRSEDGESWNKLQDLPAAGYSNSDIEYTYIDDTISFNYTYYRLDQIDIDGSIESYGPVHVYRSRQQKNFRKTNLWGQDINDNYQGLIINDGKLQYQIKNK